jgi:hypothetical protein
MNSVIGVIDPNEKSDEPVAVGLAFAAAHAWDEPRVRPDATTVLCRLIPVATERVCQAIDTVFWTPDDFVAEESTKTLLRSLAANPRALAWISVLDLVEHLVALLPSERVLVLAVCHAILKSGRPESTLYEAGEHLVKIAMTLQRFPDTRGDGLSLLEHLLRLGLDHANTILRDIDIRPNSQPTPTPFVRRRRRRSE